MALLSICIPTLNRLDFLKASLSELLPAAQLLGVEVCVSDNASSDGTASFLAGLVSQYPCLKVRKFDVKVDIDSSMMAAIAMGTGEYIFPLGDDDCIEPGALGLLLTYLHRQDDMVVLNGWHTGPQLQKIHLHLGDDFAGKAYDRPDAAFSCLWDKMPFGSFVARANLFPQALSTRFHGTSHAYTGVVWDALAKKFETDAVCRVSCMAEPVVLLRGAEKTWRKDAIDILLFQIGVWFWRVSHQKIYRHAVLEAMKGYGRIYLKFSKLIRYRCAGELQWSSFKGLLSMWPQRRFVILAAMLLPPSLLRRYLKRRGVDYSVTGL